MRLEGTLDAFGLPDVLQLLSSTGKTGALRLRPTAGGTGVVRVVDGTVSAASPDIGRQALARRLVGAGLVPDDTLAAAVERAKAERETGLVRAIVDAAGLEGDAVLQVAADQIIDAFCELLRWTEGEFSFHADDVDTDGLGVRLLVTEVLAESRRRIESWPALSAAAPPAERVLALALSPDDDPVLNREEWGLLALVDGVRSVAEVTALAGRGVHAVGATLAGLVGRGLLVDTAVGDGGLTALLRRQDLLSSTETTPVSSPRVPATTPMPGPSGVDVPSPRAGTDVSGDGATAGGATADGATADGATAERATADGATAERATAEVPASDGPPAAVPAGASAAEARLGGGGSRQLDPAQAVHGNVAMQLDAPPKPVTLPEQGDSFVTKSLLLRLINGVQEL